MQPRNDNMLYPEWQIQLGLDKVYPGGITEIRVDIQADTGKIDGISAGGYYGTLPPTPIQSPNTNNNNTATNNGNKSDLSSASPANNTDSAISNSSTNTIIIASIVLAAVIASTTLFLKKRRSNS